MAGEEAKFTARLVDKISGPSRRAAGGFDRMRRSAEGARRGFDSVSGSARRGGRSLNSFAGASRRAGGAFSGAMSVLGGNLLTGVVEKVARLAVSTGKAAVEFAMFGENSRLAFDQLAKHGASPEKLFQHSIDLAQELGLGVRDTTKQFSKFLALQFNPDQATDLIKLGGDLRVLGATADEVKGAFLAIGQIKSKGRLQGEEMLQLQERGISGELVKDALAKRLGVDVGEVDKLQAAGKISADVALPAIQDALLKKLGTSTPGEASKIRAETTSAGAFDQLSSKFEATAVKFGDKFAPALNNFAGEALDKLGAFMDSEDGSKFIDTAATAFSSIADALGTAMPYVIEFSKAVGGSFMDTLGGIGDVVGGMFSNDGKQNAKEWMGALKTLGNTMGQLLAVGAALAGVYVSYQAGMAVLYSAAWETGKGILTGLWSPIEKMAGDLILWWEDIGAVFDAEGLSIGDKALKIGKFIATGLGNGIVSMLSYPVDAIMGMGRDVIDGLKRAVGVESPSWMTDEIGGFTSIGFGDGMVREGRHVEQEAERQGERFMASLEAGTGGGGFNFSTGGSMDQFEAIESIPEARHAAPAPIDTAQGFGQTSTVQVTVPVTVNVEGNADGAQIGREIADELEPRLTSIFSQLAYSTGGT